jgi:hypothetical protein
MNNMRCSVDQRINGQRTYQRTTEVVPSSGWEYTHNYQGAFKKKRLIDICSGTRVMAILKSLLFRNGALIYLRPLYTSKNLQN